MSRRLLLVDDDQSLLRSFERMLGMHYDLATADCPLAAIERLKTDQEFPVVVTDMRMPSMDGVRFAQAGGEVSPRSVFLMLTGNQDVETAIRAINEGEVYRFLTKPAESEQLCEAIDSALEKYDRERAEQQLLQGTFVGAINAVTTVLERVEPGLIDIGVHVTELVSQLAAALKIENRWEYQVSARFSLLGVAMTRDLHLDELTGADPIEDNRELFEEAANGAAELLDKIPRLQNVAKMIRRYPGSDGVISAGSPRTDRGIVLVGAALLRVSLQSYFGLRIGIDTDQVAREVGISLPNASKELIEALERVDPGEITVRGQELSVYDLKPGMVLSKDITSATGNMLVRRGKRLQPAMIDKLKSMADSSGLDLAAEVRVAGAAAG